MTTTENNRTAKPILSYLAIHCQCLPSLPFDTQPPFLELTKRSPTLGNSTCILVFYIATSLVFKSQIKLQMTLWNEKKKSPHIPSLHLVWILPGTLVVGHALNCACICLLSDRWGPHLFCIYQCISTSKHYPKNISAKWIFYLENWQLNVAMIKNQMIDSIL